MLFSLLVLVLIEYPEATTPYVAIYPCKRRRPSEGKPMATGPRNINRRVDCGCNLRQLQHKQIHLYLEAPGQRKRNKLDERMSTNRATAMGKSDSTAVDMVKHL